MPNLERYYREVHGFNIHHHPCHKKDDQMHVFEAFAPVNDPHLPGLWLGAHVRSKLHRLSGETWTHNEILFLYRDRKAAVTCVHTGIMEMPFPEAIDDLNAGGNKILQTSMDLGIILPPEEHFAALKSYVAAIAETGISNLLQAAWEQDAGLNPFGFNSMMQEQVLFALAKVMPEYARSLETNHLAEMFEGSPEEWIVARVDFFFKGQYIPDWGAIIEALSPPKQKLIAELLIYNLYSTRPWDAKTCEVVVKYATHTHRLVLLKLLEGAVTRTTILLLYHLRELDPLYAEMLDWTWIDFRLFARKLRESDPIYAELLEQSYPNPNHSTHYAKPYLNLPDDFWQKIFPKKYKITVSAEIALLTRYSARELFDLPREFDLAWDGKNVILKANPIANFWNATPYIIVQDETPGELTRTRATRALRRQRYGGSGYPRSKLSRPVYYKPKRHPGLFRRGRGPDNSESRRMRRQRRGY